MKLTRRTIYKGLTFTALGLVMASCGKNAAAAKFEFTGDFAQKKYTFKDQVAVQIANPDAWVVDSVVYKANDKRIHSSQELTFSWPLSDAKLGYSQLVAEVYFEGQSEPKIIQTRLEVVSDVEPVVREYEIVKRYAHNRESFTQGLEFYRDTLMESTGQHGASRIMKWNIQTGEIYQQADLEQAYFGEGITVLNDKVYQLTWQSMVGFVYDANTLKREKQFNYSRKVEGWGITNDGNMLYQTDGTEKIWTLDPATLELKDYVNVYAKGSKIKALNELEWIDGKIYGNVWQRDAIAIIDPKTGVVEEIINLAALRSELTSEQAEVLNGIAYNPKTKTIFVTGKYWDKMFEIRLK